MPSNVIQGRFLGPAAMRSPGPPAASRSGPSVPLAIQRRNAGGTAVDSSVLRTSGPGAALPSDLRRHMEATLGADFSSVRIHVGPQAERIGAIAFTSGADIYFAPGRYQPETPAGRRLLGHELAHVVQQRQGRVRNPAGGVAIVQDAALEAEADRMGDRAASAPLQMKPARPEPQKTHKLIVSESRHRGLNANRLAPEAAAHSAVTLVRPSGVRETFSFGPKDHLAPNSAANVQRLRAGVPGAVRREAGAAPRPGAGVREIAITADQARAAEATIRRQGAGTFRLGRDDCHGFAQRIIHSVAPRSATTAVQRMQQQAPQPADIPFIHAPEHDRRTYVEAVPFGRQPPANAPPELRRHSQVVREYEENPVIRPLGFNNIADFTSFMLMLFDEVGEIDDLHFAFTGSSVEGVKYLWARPHGHVGAWNPMFDGRGPSDYDLAICSGSLYSLFEELVENELLPRSTLQNGDHTCALHQHEFRVLHDYVMQHERHRKFRNLINLFVRAQENGRFCTQQREVNFMVYRRVGDIAGHTGRALIYKEDDVRRTIGLHYVAGAPFDPNRRGL